MTEKLTYLFCGLDVGHLLGDGLDRERQAA